MVRKLYFLLPFKPSLCSLFHIQLLKSCDNLVINQSNLFTVKKQKKIIRNYALEIEREREREREILGYTVGSFILRV